MGICRGKDTNIGSQNWPECFFSPGTNRVLVKLSGILRDQEILHQCEQRFTRWVGTVSIFTKEGKCELSNFTLDH